MSNKGHVKVTYNEAIDQGVELCRQGNWDEGMMCLNHILQTSRKDQLPGVLFSYLGYGIARKEGRVREGLSMCKKAVEMEFYEPSHFLNLARCNLLIGNRRAVAQALDEGLKLDPSHAGLLKLQGIFGVRAKPVLPFLKRGNPINIMLGKMRHSLRARDSKSLKARHA